MQKVKEKSKFPDDITGMKFNKLMVIKKVKDKNNHTKWQCKCDCGNVVELVKSKVTSRNIGCGCSRVPPMKSHNMCRTRPYRIWIAMKARCYKKYSPSYERYGEKNITVCDSWKNSFENFWEDMKEGYSDDLTLDRIDSSKGYSKENCRWADYFVQGNNRSNVIQYTAFGETNNLSYFCNKYNVKRGMVNARIYELKWDLEKALTVPNRQDNDTTNYENNTRICGICNETLDLSLFGKDYIAYGKTLHMKRCKKCVSKVKSIYSKKRWAEQRK